MYAECPRTAAFSQCPAVDHDTACQFLITVTNSGVQVAQDSVQGPYDGEDDALIGIQNGSSRAISSIPLSAENSLFGFESDGLFSPGAPPVAPGCVVLAKNSSNTATTHPGSPCPPETEACGFPPPAGEPLGVTFTSSINGYGANGDAVTGYEGPTSWFSSIATTSSSGIVNFSPAIAPGGSTYFSLESPPTGKSITVGNPATLTTALSGGGQIGAAVTVAQGTPVLDTATVGGAGGATASGTVSYAVYNDKACTALVTQAGTATVTNGAAGPSTAMAKLRGLPKGTFKVSLITRSSAGRLYEDGRTFHTCVPGHHKKK